MILCHVYLYRKASLNVYRKFHQYKINITLKNVNFIARQNISKH